MEFFLGNGIACSGEWLVMLAIICSLRRSVVDMCWEDIPDDMGSRESIIGCIPIIPYGFICDGHGFIPADEEYCVLRFVERSIYSIIQWFVVASSLIVCRLSDQEGKKERVSHVWKIKSNRNKSNRTKCCAPPQEHSYAQFYCLKSLRTLIVWSLKVRDRISIKNMEYRISCIWYNDFWVLYRWVSEDTCFVSCFFFVQKIICENLIQSI